MRFDVVAIDNRPRQPPVVRLHKSALRSAVWSPRPSPPQIHSVT
jgi:hypothetical protein